GDPLDRRQRGDVLPLAPGVWRAEERPGQAAEGARDREHSAASRGGGPERRPADPAWTDEVDLPEIAVTGISRMGRQMLWIGGGCAATAGLVLVLLVYRLPPDAPRMARGPT